MRLFILVLLGMYLFYQLSFLWDQPLLFAGGSILYILAILLDGCDTEYRD
jgi:hypothetical protein